MIAVSEAERLIDQAVVPLPPQTIDTAKAAGRILRQDVAATRDQPPFHRATMDGIALSSEDAGTALRVSGIAPAGTPPLTYQGAGTCIEIMTGAVVPEGCNVVVPVEQITRDGDTVRVQPQARREPGTFVHARGSDHVVGTPLLAAGMRLEAAALAVLVSTGLPRVSVTRQPRLSVLASGDELVDLGEPAADHQVRRSNDYAAAAMLAAHGWRDVTRAHVPDEPDAVAAAVSDALTADVAIFTGGVSRGRYDFLPEALEAGGVVKVFHRVAQRPGKPMWFGLGPDGQLVFGLPGNPVSALTCLRRYVLPALTRLSGLAKEPEPGFATLASDTAFAPPLAWLAAARRVPTHDGRLVVETVPVNTSGDFTSLVGTDGIIELPADASAWEAGTPVRWFAW